jgi:hypothetical protein
MTVCKMMMWALLVTGAYGFGVVSAQCQMVPPPPVRDVTVTDMFSPSDRGKLIGIYRMVRAMHARLFPLSEEDKILKGGTVEP